MEKFFNCFEKNLRELKDWSLVDCNILRGKKENSREFSWWSLLVKYLIQVSSKVTISHDTLWSQDQSFDGTPFGTPDYNKILNGAPVILEDQTKPLHMQSAEAVLKAAILNQLKLHFRENNLTLFVSMIVEERWHPWKISSPQRIKRWSGRRGALLRNGDNHL